MSNNNHRARFSKNKSGYKKIGDSYNTLKRGFSRLPKWRKSEDKKREGKKIKKGNSKTDSNN